MQLQEDKINQVQDTAHSNVDQFKCQSQQRQVFVYSFDGHIKAHSQEHGTQRVE